MQFGRRKSIDRGECSWIADFLAAAPLYDSPRFKRQFSVPRAIYDRLAVTLAPISHVVPMRPARQR